MGEVSIRRTSRSRGPPPRRRSTGSISRGLGQQLVFMLQEAQAGGGEVGDVQHLHLADHLGRRRRGR